MSVFGYVYGNDQESDHQHTTRLQAVMVQTQCVINCVAISRGPKTLATGTGGCKNQ